MEPIPESREAVDEFGPFVDDGDLLEQLADSGEQVREMVPTCVGITLALVREGVAFTLVATDAELAALDAVQYLGDGPCVRSAVEAQTITFEVDDPTDEQRWLRFARASASRGIASTLTLPIFDGGGAADRDGSRVIGSVNLYASTHRAFDGHHEEVADLFGAWAGGAVTNADLAFDSRRAAQQAPGVLRDQMKVSQAVGRLVVVEQVDADTARQLLEDAAVRAGVDVTAVAVHVLESWENGELSL